MKKIERVFLIVLDSFGIGAAPDAEEFGDGECHTLQTIVKSAKYNTPHMRRMGLFHIDGVNCGVRDDGAPSAAFGRLREQSRGKDTTSGHWEISGIVSESPLPTYPHGFPPEIIAKLEEAFGRKVLCNKPYSGTQVIHDYGREQKATGGMIVYTSVDSVLQIAAHEEQVPVEELYACCRKAREIMSGKYAVGRVIARPYVGEYPNYQRTSRRHDFSLEPPGATILDALSRAGYDTIGIGKISDIFAGRGIQRNLGGNRDDDDGMDKAMRVLGEDFSGLCFVNLVDFDMRYGHRRDIDGYAGAATAFDRRLAEFIPKMREGDVLLITADHGCDPGAPGTDHTREYVPLLAYGQSIRAGVNLGTRDTFADIAATVAEIFGVELLTKGHSFLPLIALPPGA